MIAVPLTLPPLISMDSFGGNWASYCDALYAGFCEDFIQERPLFRGMSVRLMERGLNQGREGTFWHLIQGKDGASGPDYRRCERIRYAKALIENADDPAVRCWVRINDGRIQIATDDFSYVVSLVPRRTCVLLLTGYYLEYRNTRDQLKRGFEDATKG